MMFSFTEILGGGLRQQVNFIDVAVRGEECDHQMTSKSRGRTVGGRVLAQFPPAAP